MHNITIVGTEPMCPRCQLLKDVVVKKVKEMKIDAFVNHISYTKDEALEYAKSVGCIPGTAKDVAAVCGVELDYEKLMNIIEKPAAEDNEYVEFSNSKWSKELDDFLKPFEILAKKHKILMTPVLIINNTIVVNGHIPDLNSLEKMLFREFDMEV
jgi:hypothetical protein